MAADETTAPSATPTSGGGAARLTVLSGPSGVGKGSVVAAVRRRHPDVWVSVSVTTRAPRAGEVDGREYSFVDRATFDELVASDQLLEHAEYAGNAYGTPRGPLVSRLAAGVPCLLEIEVEGARQVRRRDPGALLVFLAPPSWEELVRRLTGRGTEEADVVRRRLDRALVELAAESEFDETLVNDDVEACADRLVALATRSG